MRGGAMWTKICAALLLVTGIAVPTVIGIIQTDYDPMSQYLSELGAEGAPYADIMAYAGFLPSGILLALALLGLPARLPKVWAIWLGLCAIGLTSVSYIGAVIYPCDPGCPVEPDTVNQLAHNMAGLVGYLGSIAGLFLVHGGLNGKVSAVFSTATLGAAVIITLGLFAMATPEIDSLKGLSQRAADFTLFLWVALMSFASVKESAPGSAQPE